MAFMLVFLGWYEFLVVPRLEKVRRASVNKERCDYAATTLLLTESSTSKSARMFLQGWLGTAKSEGRWEKIWKPSDPNEAQELMTRNAAWGLGLVAATDVLAAGIASESKVLTDMNLQLLLAPIIDRGDAPDWEAAWSPLAPTCWTCLMEGACASDGVCCGDVPACVSPSTSPMACACRDNVLEPAGILDVMAEACDKRGLCCNEEVDDACRGKVLMGRQVWDFDHDLTADKMCYGDDAKECTGLFKDTEEAPPPTNPDVAQQSKIAPCTYAWFFNDDDGVVTTQAGPGNYTFPPGGTTEGWNEGDATKGPATFNVSPYDFVLGIDAIAYLGGRLAEEGSTCGAPAAPRPCTALDVLARGETFVEQHDDRNWAFFYVWEEGPHGAAVGTPTEDEPFAGVLAVGIMMFQGPKSVLELLTLKHRRIHYREADARKSPPAGEYNPQPDYTVDKRRVTKGDDYAKATVRRPLHTTPFEIICEDWTPLPKLDEGNLRFIVTLIILGTIALLTLALVWRWDEEHATHQRLLTDADAVIDHVGDGVVVLTYDEDGYRVLKCNQAADVVAPNGDVLDGVLRQKPVDRSTGTALDAILAGPNPTQRTVTVAVDVEGGRTVEIVARQRFNGRWNVELSWVVCLRDVTERFNEQREKARVDSLERMTLFVVGVRRDGAVALWSQGAREATGLDRPGSLANLPFAHTSDRRKALQEVRRIADGGAPRPFALSLRARHGFVSLVMQNVNDISGTVAATFIGTPIDASLLTLATDGTHLKNAEFLTTGSHVSSWACAVPVAESVAEASNVHEVGRAPPLPGIEERSETNASLFDRRSVVSGFTARTDEEQAAVERTASQAPFMRDPARLRSLVLGPGEGCLLGIFDQASLPLRVHPLVQGAAHEQRIQIGASAWQVARADITINLPAGTYAFAAVPQEGAIRIGVGAHFERRRRGAPWADPVGVDDAIDDDEGAWYALVGLGGADLLHRYAGDFETLYEDLRAVAGGVLEVDPFGLLTRWAVVNPYVADQGETAALAARVPLPQDKLYLQSSSGILTTTPAGYETRASLAKACAAARRRVARAARAARRTQSLDALLQAQASFLALRRKLRDAGGAGAYQRERGQRTVLRDLGLLDDREKRFRARRRLCWIGQRDPGSILSRLPAHVLDEVVPYFDPAPRAAV